MSEPRYVYISASTNHAGYVYEGSSVVHGDKIVAILNRADELEQRIKKALEALKWCYCGEGVDEVAAILKGEVI